MRRRLEASGLLVDETLAAHFKNMSNDFVRLAQDQSASLHIRSIPGAVMHIRMRTSKDHESGIIIESS